MSSPGTSSRNMRRNAVNNLMLGLCGLCAFLTVSTLFVVLGFLAYNGISSVNLNFFIKLPLSPGQIGGGMANATRRLAPRPNETAIASSTRRRSCVSGTSRRWRRPRSDIHSTVA